MVETRVMQGNIYPEEMDSIDRFKLICEEFWGTVSVEDGELICTTDDDYMGDALMEWLKQNSNVLKDDLKNRNLFGMSVSINFEDEDGVEERYARVDDRGVFSYGASLKKFMTSYDSLAEYLNEKEMETGKSYEDISYDEIMGKVEEKYDNMPIDANPRHYLNGHISCYFDDDWRMNTISIVCEGNYENPPAFLPDNTKTMLKIEENRAEMMEEDFYGHLP